MNNIPYDIIKEAADGSMEAFEAIYRQASGYVYTVAYRVTNNKEDAEEVMQDVFLSIHKNLSKFRFKSSLKTWIYRITVNKAINASNKRAKNSRREVRYDEYMSGSKNDTVKEENKMDIKDMVKKMLAKLTPEQRACIVLKDIEGFKYNEISHILGIRVNTVRSRLKRGREKLISLYGKGGSKYEV